MPAHTAIERAHTRWISSTTCLTRVTDEHKVCNGVRSHLSAEEMSKQIYLWCRPQVLIVRSIFCNKGVWVWEHLRDRLIVFAWIWSIFNYIYVKKMQLYLPSFLFKQLCAPVFVCRWCFHAACLCPLRLGRERLPLTASERESATGRAWAWRTLLEHAYDSTESRYKKKRLNP